jgi:ATP-dependent Clp protease protease subunit
MKPSPIRCFDGNAKPYEPFWAFRNAAESESGETEIEFYGPISEFLWWGDEISPKLFKEQLYAKGGGQPVTVRLNSPGGDLIAASVIRATMVDYPGRITVKVDGLAASAAVMVAMGGDVIKIQVSAYMMIHEAAVGLLGYFNVATLKDLIDELKVINNGIVEAYAARTKMESGKLNKMMSDETWMTASEAVSFGFADEIISGPNKQTSQAAAQVTNYVNQLKSTYVNIPSALLSEVQEPAPENQTQATDGIERQAQRLAAHARQFINKE